jgi:hypothetical protein
MYDPFGLCAWLDLDADTRASVNGVLLTMLCIASLWSVKLVAKRTVKLAGLVLACFRAWRTVELTDFDQAVLGALEDPGAGVDQTGRCLTCKRVKVWLEGHEHTGTFDVRVGDASCLGQLSRAGRKAVEREAYRLRGMIEENARELARLEMLDQLTNLHRKPEGKNKPC